MNGLMGCGVCCMLISAWGIIQLIVMGFLFFFESPVLLEECEAEQYDDYDDFINKTKLNYRAVAKNCWIASGMYAVTLFMSCMCIMKAQRDAAQLAKLEEDDEYVCNLPTQKTIKDNN